MLCLGVFDDAFLYGFVLVGSFLFVTRGYAWIIPASSCKHFDSKTLLCIMIGADNVSIRLVLFFGGGFFWITGFWKYSYSEVRVATWYGSTWLEERASWVNFRAETRLGAWAYAAAEDVLRLHLREGRRWQVQLPFSGAEFRQLQLLRGQLQLPDGVSCLSSAMSVEACSAHSWAQTRLHVTPHKRGFFRSVGDRLNNPPISGAFSITRRPTPLKNSAGVRRASGVGRSGDRC